MHPLIFVLGPTASGKSDLALTLAQEFGGAIFNSDSLQTYKRLDIGTAKPSLEERAKVPHFLFDILRPNEVLTAGDYRRAALDVLLRELPQRLGFLVGGSGFYIQALEKGMFDLPKPTPEVEARVRETLAKEGLPAMHSKLCVLDPETGEELNPNDAYRITRALIIIEDSGRKFSDLKKDFRPETLPFPILKFGLAPSREELVPRVEERTRRMLQAGLVKEVKTLLEEGFASWPALKSVGYKECVDLLSGRLEPENLQKQIVEKTIQLAKKQKTWFKRDKEIQWLDTQDPLPQARLLLTQFLDTLR